MREDAFMDIFLFIILVFPKWVFLNLLCVLVYSLCEFLEFKSSHLRAFPVLLLLWGRWFTKPFIQPLQKPFASCYFWQHFPLNFIGFSCISSQLVSCSNDYIQSNYRHFCQSDLFPYTSPFMVGFLKLPEATEKSIILTCSFL